MDVDQFKELFKEMLESGDVDIRVESESDRFGNRIFSTISVDIDGENVYTTTY